LLCSFLRNTMRFLPIRFLHTTTKTSFSWAYCTESNIWWFWTGSSKLDACPDRGHPYSK
jgi:hypothetical protein